jgi:hypothetical protein
LDGPFAFLVLFLDPLLPLPSPLALSASLPSALSSAVVSAFRFFLSADLSFFSAFFELDVFFSSFLLLLLALFVSVRRSRAGQQQQAKP